MTGETGGESSVELIAVAAVAENLVIGDDGEIPWPSLPTDREQYRARVAGDPVVIGRRTFDAMRDDLPGARQVVLSRSVESFDVPTARRAGSVEDALGILGSMGADRGYVIGGGAVYELFQPHVDRMFLSRVPGEYEGDTYFPEWDEREWALVDETPYENFTLQEWVRER